MLKTKYIVYLVLTCILAVSCQPRNGNKLFDPNQVAFTAEYNPLFDGQIYPSMLLATNQATSNSSNSQLPVFNLTVTAPTDNAVLRIVVDSSALNYVTILQEILPHRGEQYTFQPSIKWKYDILRRLRQPGAVDFTFYCYINDEEVDIKNLHLAYRTVNECPLSLMHQGHRSDFRWLFAAYVN